MRNSSVYKILIGLLIIIIIITLLIIRPQTVYANGLPIGNSIGSTDQMQDNIA